MGMVVGKVARMIVVEIAVTMHGEGDGSGGETVEVVVAMVRQ